jgi:hypothetical protein
MATRNDSPSIEWALFSTTKSHVQSSRESNYSFVEFCAALITLPALSLSFLTDFMFPAATDRFMSRTAILPSGGISTNVSTHIGLDGTIITLPTSPFFTLIISGLLPPFYVLPVWQSIFSFSFENFHAI